jgi:hypothetical protein
MRDVKSSGLATPPKAPTEGLRLPSNLIDIPSYKLAIPANPLTCLGLFQLDSNRKKKRYSPFH